MIDEKKIIKTATIDNDPANGNSTASLSNSTGNTTTDIPKKKWIDHWLIQAILVTLYIKIFGPLGGLCGLGVFFYIKRSRGTGFAIAISAVVSAAVWWIAITIIKNQM
jgi:hypothetical protein